MPPRSDAARVRRRPARSFAIGGRIRPGRYVAIAGAVFAGLGLLWWGVTAAGLVLPLFLPSPGQVLSRLGELRASGQLAADVGISVYRITVGFLISTALALPIGIL
ncbi:MAG TPA: hypothetical protein VM422_01485, partial [Amaricoccus sp.]|nr:hypothetical protein [Amaricoccus sp.]